MSLQIAIVKQATLFGEAFETGAVTQARSTKKGQPWGATMGVGQLIFCKRVLNSPLCGSEVFDSTFTFESGENRNSVTLAKGLSLPIVQIGSVLVISFPSA